jgi:membrane protease YdiL (CAAX protease family)
MATDFDPYAILQVPRSAGQQEIDEAYRRQWAAYPGDPTPEVRLRELQTAYRILSDPVERRAYDERLAERAEVNGVAPLSPGYQQPAPVVDPPERVPWGLKEILQAVGIVVGGVILLSIPVFFLADWVAGSAEIDEDPESLAVQYVASAIFQVAALGAAWWFSVRKFNLDWGALGLRRPQRGMPWLPFSMVIVGLFVVGAYGVLLDLAGVNPDTEFPDAAYDNALPLVIILFIAIGLAPLVEELFFRGFAFAGFAQRLGMVWGGLASALLFGLAHLGNSGYLYVVPPIVMIGALFAWGYHYSKSILPSIAAHLMFNLIQVIGTLATR